MLSFYAMYYKGMVDLLQTDGSIVEPVYRDHLYADHP